VAESIFDKNPDEITNATAAAVFNVRASLETESNKFQEAYADFSKKLEYIQKALTNGELQRPCLEEIFALGGVGNGLQGIHSYAEAEDHYRRSMEAYKIFGSNMSVVSVVPTNLATCLWLQHKDDEAETLLRSIIVDPDDTSNYR
jgi:prophage DNA circulation protein